MSRSAIAQRTARTVVESRTDFGAETDRTAAMAGDCVGSGFAQPVNALVPQTVAGECGRSRRTGQSRHHKRGEDAIMAGSRTFPGEKFLDLVDHSVDIASPDWMIPARDFHKACAPDLPGELASARDLHPRIVGAMNDKGRNPNARERMAHIDLGIHARKSDRCRWADRKAFEASPPCLETRVVDPTGRKIRQRGAGPPRPLGAVQEDGQSVRPHDGGVEVGIAAIEHEGARARRIGCGKQDRHRGALGGAKQSRAPPGSSQ
jgi:hypothetical protein